MTNEELLTKIYSKIDELPTLPAVVPKILKLMESDDTDIIDLTDVISRDPALTSKILKVANSAYYGFTQNISDLNRAVALLGFQMVKSLALSIGVIKCLPASKKSPHFSWEGLWVHSLAVATLIHELGKRHGSEGDKEYLFIIGLLHDIGKIVFEHFFREQFHRALEAASGANKQDQTNVERRELGLDHGEVGAILLQRWKFPEEIISPVAVHHNREVPENIDLFDIAILRVADSLASEIGFSMDRNQIPPEIDEKDLSVLKLNETDLKDTRAFLKGSTDGIHEFVSAMG